jgi:hypothetical protein
VLGPEILVSIGMGLAFVPMNSTALFGVHEDSAGVASALVNTTQQVGGALGTAFLNTVAASSTAAFLLTRVVSTSVTRSADVHGYTNAFEVSALLVAMAAVVAGVLISSKRSHHVPEPVDATEDSTWVDDSPRFEIPEVPPYRLGRQSELS